MSAARSAVMSEEDEKEAIALRSFAAAYERALTQVLMDHEFTITPNMKQSMSDIITRTPNPLIKVELLMDRFKDTALGKKVMVMAILANDHGLAEKVRNSEQAERARLIEEAEQRAEAMRMGLAEKAAAAAAIDADKIRISQGIPYGTYTELFPPPAHPLAKPFTLALPPPKKGGKKSAKKSHKKSHKKGGKKSHKKSHRRRH